MRSAVRFRVGVAAGLLVLVSGLKGQQPPQPQPQQKQPEQAQQPQGQQAKGQAPPIVVYRIDLVPNGSVFAMGEPTLEGDVYVFRSLPERTMERLPKAKVKAIIRRSTDMDKEVVYQVDVVPTGSFLAREEPVKKGKTYVLTTWKTGDLVSLRESDVRKITRLTGFPAWKAEMTALGVVVLEGETTAAGFKTTGDSPAAPGSGSPQAAPSTQPGNWTYQGTPGSSDAYAPAGGTVARPGDTPMAPTPPPPRR